MHLPPHGVELPHLPPPLKRRAAESAASTGNASAAHNTGHTTQNRFRARGETTASAALHTLLTSELATAIAREETELDFLREERNHGHSFSRH